MEYRSKTRAEYDASFTHLVIKSDSTSFLIRNLVKAKETQERPRTPVKRKPDSDANEEAPKSVKK